MGLVLAATNVFAQSYPTRAVRLIVPYSAGGATDIVCRILAQALTQTLGQRVYVENRPGAGAIIGTGILAKAAPDGYTIMMADIAHASNVALHKTLPYDSVRNFEPVSLVATLPTVLLVNPQVPVTSVKELVALAKAKPASLNFSSSGIGSSSHLAGELFESETGTTLVHIPYNGGGESMSALIAGDVQVLFITLPAALQHIKSGKVRVLSVSGDKRIPMLPKVPTLTEQGYASAELSLWMGILVPAETPQAIVTKLNHDIVRALATPTVRQKISEQGAFVVGSSPEEFGQYIATQTARWLKTIKPEMRLD
jgi:tripartite-type tricarboxylate transporter receptor subunit TctC